MVGNLSLGAMMISTTVLMHTLGLLILTRSMSRIIGWFRLHAHDLGKTAAMVATVLGLFVLHTLEVWAWALAFLLTGAVPGLEPALYFSTVTFATVGYGDIILPESWRLFASLEGINGFLLIGWSTAYLFAASTRYGPFTAATSL